MRKIFAPILAAACVAALLPAAANADVITSPVGAYDPFPVVNYFGPGPQTFSGIVWTSTNASNQGGSVFGYDEGYGFGPNGMTSETLVGLNDNFDDYGVVDSMTFSFSTPVSAVGAVLNWYPTTTPVTIAAFDSADNLIESFTLQSGGANIATPNTFYGFQESTADISSFVLTDGYVAALGGLNVAATAAVPEPATWALMLVGFGLVGCAMRKRIVRTSVSYS